MQFRSAAILLATLIVSTYTQAFMPSTRAYALHTTINLYQCATHLYTSTYALTDCALQLCNRIGVRPLGQAASVYHQAGYGFSSGYTITQQASNHTTITLHVDEQRGSIYIDIFSAMRYAPDTLAYFAATYFQAVYAEHDEDTRG